MVGRLPVCVVIAGLGLVAGVGRAEIRITGTGASFPAPLYKKWVETYNKTHADAMVDYQAVGSGAGIKALGDRTIDFGATDAPMTAAQEKACPSKILHLPTVAGSAVMIYNLDGIKELKLNGDMVADIYLGKIKVWNDPKLVALNPDTPLPEIPIIVTHRMDGSGTTWYFTDYLGKLSKEWSEKVGKGTTVQWPVGLGGGGGPGPVALVKSNAGSIGYVEYAFAQANRIPYATLLNKEGKAATPSVENVTAAISASLPFPDDLKASITHAPGASSYPMCGLRYLLVYEDLSYMKEKAKAQATADFLLWCETEGQKMAAENGYAPLPKEAQEKAVTMIKTLQYNGEKLVK